MKKTQKTLGIVSLVMLMLGTLVTAVSAATVGDPYTMGGYHIGWILVGIGVFVFLAAVVVASVASKGKAIKFGAPIFVIAVAFVLVGAFTFTDVAVTQVTTESVTWDVTCASDTADLTINNDARTITKLIWADVDFAVINATDDSVWVDAVDDMWLNFTITPSMAIGVSATTNQATTNCAVLNPDKTFSEDGTSYDLFEEVTANGDKNVAWTTDGTSDYESKLITVTIGGSETASLYITLLDDGLSQYEAGESQSFQISVGGITYTATVIVTALT